MSESLESTPEIEQSAVPNSQIAGVNHALNRNFIPTMNIALGKPNIQTQFKCDMANKRLYTLSEEHWTPTHSKTLAKWKEYKKKYKLTPDETVEQMTLEENAKYPDGQFKYYVSYKMFKRLRGQDGNEYLVRTGYLHGISFMNKEWKYPKKNFDFHYEPLFEQSVGPSSTGFNPVYGDWINSVKTYHTLWDPTEFDKSLRDIPFPGNTSLGVTFKVGVEGAMGVTSIPSLDIFRNKSFDDLYSYAKTGDRSYLEFSEEELKLMEKPKAVKKK